MGSVRKTKIGTMEEFARAVGLSRPTVSKYFQDPASVRAKTRVRIETVLKQSGFRPNIFAVNLNRRRTKIIGLIVPDPSDPFYAALAQQSDLDTDTILPGDRVFTRGTQAYAHKKMQEEPK